MKSPAECLLFLNTLNTIKPFIDNNTIEADRIFKLSGRYELNDGFNLDTYLELNGKYVFKKRVQSWIDPNLSLLDVRLWSFDIQLFDKTKEMYSNALKHTSNGFDLEHAVFFSIDQNLLHEVDVIYAKGRTAPEGSWRYD